MAIARDESFSYSRDLLGAVRTALGRTASARPATAPADDVEDDLGDVPDSSFDPYAGIRAWGDS